MSLYGPNALRTCFPAIPIVHRPCKIGWSKPPIAANSGRIYIAMKYQRASEMGHATYMKRVIIATQSKSEYKGGYNSKDDHEVPTYKEQLVTCLFSPQ